MIYAFISASLWDWFQSLHLRLFPEPVPDIIVIISSGWNIFCRSTGLPIWRWFMDLSAKEKWFTSRCFCCWFSALLPFQQILPMKTQIIYIWQRTRMEHPLPICCQPISGCVQESIRVSLWWYSFWYLWHFHCYKSILAKSRKMWKIALLLKSLRKNRKLQKRWYTFNKRHTFDGLYLVSK